MNFKFLPFFKAIHLPIDIYGSLRLLSTKGRIILPDIVKPGMIKLGSQGRDMFPVDSVILDIRGTLKFNGSFYIGCGSTIRVEENATVEIGDNSRFGAQTIVFCEKQINIGNQVEGSWRCQIMDTDRHNIMDTVTGEVKESIKPIQINNNVWIGNNVLINKGTVIPEDTIVSSFSICNKDYSHLDRYSIIGGVPAKLLSTNKKRIWTE